MSWLDKNYRVKFLQEINSNENKARKAKSLQEYEIYNGNINQYVEEYLRQQLSARTVKKMPIISSIEICKRIADQEASVYKTEPKREFIEASEDDAEALEYIYDDCMADIKLMKSNRYYKLQGQSLVQVIPKDGKIDLRILFPHNYDVVPDTNDPEKAESVVISVFDKQNYVQGGNAKQNNSNALVAGNFRDNSNQSIADSDDYKAHVEKYVVWSKEFNFIMNGKGEIISGEDMSNPLGMLPFVDVAVDKDFNYFVDKGSQLSNFAVQYNAALSDLANIVRLQGYSQAVFIGPKETMPDEIIVGPTSVIKIASDPNSANQPDFRFVTPSPDLSGSIQFIEVLISNFLSSRGLSPATVSGKSQADKFTSGVDRFLALIDRFEATKQDYAIFNQVEQKVFNIIKKYLELYSNSDALDKKYWVSSSIVNAELVVSFVRPEQTQSEIEKLDVIQRKMELGLMDTVEAIMYLDGVDRSTAELKIESMRGEDEQEQIEANSVGSQPDIQS
jgi:hypothetical protein